MGKYLQFCKPWPPINEAPYRVNAPRSVLHSTSYNSSELTCVSHLEVRKACLYSTCCAATRRGSTQHAHAQTMKIIMSRECARAHAYWRGDDLVELAMAAKSRKRKFQLICKKLRLSYSQRPLQGVQRLKRTSPSRLWIWAIAKAYLKQKHCLLMRSRFG